MQRGGFLASTERGKQFVHEKERNMAMQRRLMAMLFAFGAALALPASAQNPASPERPVGAAAPMTLRQPPPEMMRRYSALQSVPQPSARAWVGRQAQIEARRPAPNLAALERATRIRFAHPPPRRLDNVSNANKGIEAMAFLVLMEASKPAEQDLESIMQGVRAINAAKEQLRQLINQANSFVASNPGYPGVGCGVSDNQVCTTCQALSAKLDDLARITASLQQPVRLHLPARRLRSLGRFSGS
jgi:hypothetical protein